jgi:hypothetical protein
VFRRRLVLTQVHFQFLNLGKILDSGVNNKKKKELVTEKKAAEKTKDDK